MTKLCLRMIDKFFRLSILSLKIIIKLLALVNCSCKYLAKLLIVLLFMMILDKLSIIDMFAKYYFNEMVIGTLFCILIYGFSCILKMFINDDWIYQIECFNDRLLRNLVSQNKKTISNEMVLILKHGADTQN